MDPHRLIFSLVMAKLFPYQKTAGWESWQKDKITAGIKEFIEVWRKEDIPAEGWNESTIRALFSKTYEKNDDLADDAYTDGKNHYYNTDNKKADHWARFEGGKYLEDFNMGYQNTQEQDDYDNY